MGKWKWVNWLVVLIILAHMYYYFAVRYEANALVYVLATGGWVAIALLGYYIYVHRMGRTREHPHRATTIAPLPNPAIMERPKVTFKKKG